MNIISKSLVSTVTVASLVFATPVLGAGLAAGSYVAPAFYLGAGIGRANLEDDVEVTDLGDVSFNDDGTAYKLFGGYRATENLGVEGTYWNFGEADAGPFSVETDGLGIAVVGLVPVGPVDLFAKGGMIFWNTDGEAPVPDADGEDLMYGVGGQLNLGNLFLRLESEWFDIDFPQDAQMITGSVGWVF